MEEEQSNFNLLHQITPKPLIKKLDFEDKKFENLVVIDANGNFNNTLQSHFNGEILQIGKRYDIISIIGCQSTGKSTLLNELFGTRFATLNQLEGRKQTTQGNANL